MELFLVTGGVAIGFILWGKFWIHIANKSEIEDSVKPILLAINHIMYKKFILYGSIEFVISILGLMLPQDIGLLVLLLQVIIIYVAVAHMLVSAYNLYKKRQKA